MFFCHICDCGKTTDTCLRSSSLFRKRDPGMCLNWSYLGMCVMVANLGSPRWWFRISFSKLEVRREIYSRSLWCRLCYGRVRPGLQERFRWKWDIHQECHQTLVGRLSLGPKISLSPATSLRWGRPRGAWWDVCTLKFARIWKRPWRKQETDVVWNCEGIQLQGHIYVVQLWPWERNKCPSRIDVLEKEDKEGRRSWITYTTMWRRGILGTITRFTWLYRKMKRRIISPRREGRNGRAGGQKAIM